MRREKPRSPALRAAAGNVEAVRPVLEACDKEKPEPINKHNHNENT